MKSEEKKLINTYEWETHFDCFIGFSLENVPAKNERLKKLIRYSLKIKQDTGKTHFLRKLHIYCPISAVDILFEKKNPCFHSSKKKRREKKPIRITWHQTEDCFALQTTQCAIKQSGATLILNITHGKFKGK